MLLIESIYPLLLRRVSSFSPIRPYPLQNHSIFTFPSRYLFSTRRRQRSSTQRQEFSSIHACAKPYIVERHRNCPYLWLSIRCLCDFLLLRAGGSTAYLSRLAHRVVSIAAFSQASISLRHIILYAPRIPSSVLASTSNGILPLNP